MANLIEKAKIYQKELDKQMLADASTGWMEGNAKQLIYHGGDEVKIPVMTMDGLGDYDRQNGYPQGSVALAYQTMTMTQDRGKSFDIDAMDCDESGLDGLAGMLMGEFQRTHVVPEVDAYRLSTIYKCAAESNRLHSGFTPTKSNILDALRADIAGVQDVIGENIPLIVHTSFTVATLLDSNESISRQLSVVDFTHGEITMKVKAVDTTPILRTPSARMKTAYVFKDGDEAFGFEAAADAKNINWIITAQNAPIAVSRTDTVRIFDPNTYQKANAWHLDYRKYHDLWVPKNKLMSICANVGA